MTVDVNILTIGSQVLLSYVGGELVLDDGVLSTTYPIAAGTHTVGIALGDGNKIQLTIDGVAQTERSYTPIAQGLIDVDATHWLMRSESMLSYAESQARITSWLGNIPANAITFEGEIVTFSGEIMTHTI